MASYLPSGNYFQNILDHLNPLPDPPHRRDRHGVSERLVARPVGGWFAAMIYKRKASWKTLKCLALLNGQSTSLIGVCWFLLKALGSPCFLNR